MACIVCMALVYRDFLHQLIDDFKLRADEIDGGSGIVVLVHVNMWCIMQLWEVNTLLEVGFLHAGTSCVWQEEEEINLCETMLKMWNGQVLSPKSCFSQIERNLDVCFSFQQVKVSEPQDQQDLNISKNLVKDRIYKRYMKLSQASPHHSTCQHLASELRGSLLTKKLHSEASYKV